MYNKFRFPPCRKLFKTEGFEKRGVGGNLVNVYVNDTIHANRKEEPAVFQDCSDRKDQILHRRPLRRRGWFLQPCHQRENTEARKAEVLDIPGSANNVHCFQSIDIRESDRRKKDSKT